LRRHVKARWFVRGLSLRRDTPMANGTERGSARAFVELRFPGPEPAVKVSRGRD